MRTRSRLLVPEVVQISAMDCGPASLKCLLEGFGVSVSYGRLREACQTDVDGTSIDTIEEVANQLGLQAEQVMIPLDHVLMRETRALPAIVVVRLPNGLPHFVVAWRCHGHVMQIMDPATGRRWPGREQFLNEIYLHTHLVPSAEWREWAGSEGFLQALRRRLSDLGCTGSVIRHLQDRALADSSWRSLAEVDAAARITASIVRSSGLRRGRQAANLLERFLARPDTIPGGYWSVRAGAADPSGEERLLLRGAVLVAVQGRRKAPEKAEDIAPLAPELVAALKEAPSRPGRELLKLLRGNGLFAPAAVLIALALAAGGVITEALLFRGLFDLGRELGLFGQRLAAIGALLTFLTALLLLELPIAAGLLRLGRRLEMRLRLEFLRKIPRLGDRYFQSRLNSDMAERSHSVHRIRLLPELAGRFLRSAFQMIFTTAGIVWLDPAAAPVAGLTAALTLALPLAVQPLLAERDLRFRSHAGALSRFYLDALLGLIPIRVHGAERSLRREHENLLVEWARSGLDLQRSAVTIQALQSLVGFGLAAWLFLDHLARHGESGGVLLLLYWALSLPTLGQEVASTAWQYPACRNVTLRLLEPLGTPEEFSENEAQRVPSSPEAAATGVGGLVDQREAGGFPQAGTHIPAQSGPKRPSGVSISLEGVNIRVAGHVILEDISLSIPGGSHVAILDPPERVSQAWPEFCWDGTGLPEAGSLQTASRLRAGGSPNSAARPLG